ncbi:MAG: hypothetical protein Q7K43_03825 [Candidatus Woesearchaeota archaeon]|nr:hypothetical protein [Candidatus Woesearchaeota archaeon]
MVTPSFTKPVDDVLLVAGILKRLKAGSLASLSERIRCQKIQYFAQVLKVSSPYSFGLYLHGPYSPDLARDLFAMEQYSQTILDAPFVSEELEERFVQLQKFISNVKELRMLEITATLHWLVSEGYTKDSADKKVSELKQASAQELHKAHASLGEIV